MIGIAIMVIGIDKNVLKFLFLKYPSPFKLSERWGDKNGEERWNGERREKVERRREEREERKRGRRGVRKRGERRKRWSKEERERRRGKESG